MTSTNILCLNGSLRGRLGNTGRVVDHIRRRTAGPADVVELCLADLPGPVSALEQHLREADVLLLCSGVYWNSHGSPLQRFLEVATAWEATEVFLGKPAGVVLTMDSVGGMEVAARLLGVLNLMGCMVPPLASVVLSRVGQVASAQNEQPDVYTVGDVDILLGNLLVAATHPNPKWKTWPVKYTLPANPQYPAPGVLAIDHHPWLHT